jgi:hypothetical protein
VKRREADSRADAASQPSDELADALLLAAVSNGHGVAVARAAGESASAWPVAAEAPNREVPIETYTPVLVPALPSAAPVALAGRRVLVLGDDPALLESIDLELCAAGATAHLVCPADRTLPGALGIDLEPGADLAPAAAVLGGLGFDTILCCTRSRWAETPALLAEPLAAQTRILDLLYVVCRLARGSLCRGGAGIYGLCLDAFAGGRADAATGLLGGLLKSLARELPSTTVRNVCCAIGDARQALLRLSVELGQRREPVEVCWRGGRREAFALVPLPAAAGAGTPWVGAGSVVLVSGAARGIAAVLAEELRGRFGCTVERHDVERLDDATVARVVDGVYARHGRLDLVVHAAGMSAADGPSESIGGMRRALARKLGSLGTLYRAVRARAGASPVHFHLLTSAQSWLGDEARPGAAAADEAMSRLAASMDGRDGWSWSSLGWLDCAGVDVVEDADLAPAPRASRGSLRAVGRDEAREIFGRLVAGQPLAPVHVTLTAVERGLYRPALAPPTALPPRPAPSSLVKHFAIDLRDAPYLRDHLVEGVPTLPAAFFVGIAAGAVRELRPRLRIVAFEDGRFPGLVRIAEARATELRVDVRVVEEDADETLVRVRVLANAVEKGHGDMTAELRARLVPASRTSESPPGDAARAAVAELRCGTELPDAYGLAGSPVSIAGAFRSLGAVRVVGDRRLAQYRLADTPYPSSPLQPMLPALALVDAFWRFGAVVASGDGALPVYLPERCDRLGVFFDYSDVDLGWLHDPLVFTGSNPRASGDELLVGPIEAWDRDGRLRLVLEGARCRKLGEVAVDEVRHAV